MRYSTVLTEMCCARHLRDDRFCWKPVRTALATGTGLEPSISSPSSSHTVVRVSSNQSQTRSCTNYTNRLKNIQILKLKIKFSDILLKLIYNNRYSLFQVL
jgi:hypothetical protein